MKSTYRTEFPDFGALPSLIAAAVASGELVDVSSWNDMCPSFVRASDMAVVDAEGSTESVPVLWVDYADAEKREDPSSSRFTVQTVSDGESGSTDNELMALIDLRNARKGGAA